MARAKRRKVARPSSPASPSPAPQPAPNPVFIGVEDYPAAGLQPCPVIHLTDADIQDGVLHRGGLQKLIAKNKNLLCDAPMVILRNFPLPTIKESASDLEVKVTSQTLEAQGDLTLIKSKPEPMKVKEYKEKVNGDKTLYLQNYENPEKFIDFDSWDVKWDWSDPKELGLDFVNLGETNIPGVTKPFFYMGSKGSEFPLHEEDFSLWSMNLQIEGEPKVWQGTAPSNYKQVTKVLERMSPAENCKSWWRHKNHFVHNLDIFRNAGIPVFQAIQKAGDLIITNSFHQGFNTGLNSNLAVNIFPLEIRIPALRNMLVAVHCKTDCHWDEELSVILPFEPLRDLICPGCFHISKSTDGWKRHRVHCSTGQKYPFLNLNTACIICEQTPNHLDRHAKGHAKSFPQVCQVCREEYVGTFHSHFKNSCTRQCRNPKCSEPEKDFKTKEDVMFHFLYCH